MSGHSPKGPRRRIAGERRTGRPETGPSDQPVDEHPGTTSDEPLEEMSGRSPEPDPERSSEQPADGTAAHRAAPPVLAGATSSPPTAVDPDARAARGGGPSLPVLAGLGALALVLIAVAAYLGLHTWDYRTVGDANRVDEASRTAPAAAERAAATVLSYSYTSLGADVKAAERYLTPSFRKQYLSSMKLVEPNAPKLRAKVVASVKASGVSHADPDRVDVLVYVDQTTTSTANGGDPQVALNRAMFRMVRSTGGDWLVNGITSY